MLVPHKLLWVSPDCMALQGKQAGNVAVGRGCFPSLPPGSPAHGPMPWAAPRPLDVFVSSFHPLPSPLAPGCPLCHPCPCPAASGSLTCPGKRGWARGAPALILPLASSREAEPGCFPMGAPSFPTSSRCFLTCPALVGLGEGAIGQQRWNVILGMMLGACSGTGKGSPLL